MKVARLSKKAGIPGWGWLVMLIIALILLIILLIIIGKAGGRIGLAIEKLKEIFFS
jgi:uncharacterized membrane protein